MTSSTHVISFPLSLVFVVRLLCGPDCLPDALDLQHVGRPQEVLERGLRHGHLAVVHEGEDTAEVGGGHVAEDHDRVLARVTLQGTENGYNEIGTVEVKMILN